MTRQLCLVFIPALVVILQNAEMKKGSPLTESEVVNICDEATCIVLPFDIAMKNERERGIETSLLKTVGTNSSSFVLYYRNDF